MRTLIGKIVQCRIVYVVEFHRYVARLTHIEVKLAVCFFDKNFDCADKPPKKERNFRLDCVAEITGPSDKIVKKNRSF